MSICVVGSSNTDLVLNVDKFPKMGETVIGNHFEQFQGGKGANQAMSIAKLGGKVTFMANIGDDSFGDCSLEIYEKFGIDTKCIQKIKNEKSGIALIFVNEVGQNMIGISSGANQKLDISYIERHKKIIQQSNFILTQLEIPLDSILYLSELSKEFQIPFILNPAPALKLSSQLIKNIDILTPNETEASFYSGVSVDSNENAIKAAQEIHKQGIKVVLMTLGDKGVLLSQVNETPIFIPPYKVKAVDTIAAGDTFNGAFVFALDGKKSLYDAAVFANQAAAISVTKSGVQNSIPTLDEVKKFQVQRNTKKE